MIIDIISILTKFITYTNIKNKKKSPSEIEVLDIVKDLCLRCRVGG